MARDTDIGLGQLLDGGLPKPRKRQIEGPQEGFVKKVANRLVTFSIPEYTEQSEFGPVQLPDHIGDAHPGDSCLVVFVGGGVDRPWILGIRRS